MPVLVLELRLALAIVDPAAVRVSHQENPVMHVIRDARKVHVVETAGRLIAEDEVEVPSNHILWGGRSNFSFQRHLVEGMSFEYRQRCGSPNGAGWFACFLQHQLSIGARAVPGTYQNTL